MDYQHKTIVVASGKGGVGKSMLASSLAFLFAQQRRIAILDADVDAPNLHLWLGGVKKWDQIKKVSLSEKAVVLKKNCPVCQKWADICQFGALKIEKSTVSINPFLCEGCGACEAVLPAGVVKLKRVINGEIRVKNDLFGFPLTSAQLYPGETGSGKLVEEMKRKLNSFAADLALIDAPAGTGCPVIAALRGASFAVLITESTPSGFVDLKRILTVVNHFHLPFGVVVNKEDLNPSLTGEIASWAGKRFLGKIGYDKRIFSSIASLQPIFQTKLPVKQKIEKIFIRLLNKLS
jgi:MinD superfamily P-loop ATPase